MTSARRILISVAHPDDETFGIGGLVARYANEGADVYVICSTNGDVGTVEPELMEGYESIAELRLAELHCAAEELGVKQVFTFGYRDSGMPDTADNLHPDSLYSAPDDEVVRRIVEVIRKVRPQVVVTFDPFGGYGHPDHIKMHQTTIEAFNAAVDPERYPQQIAAGLAPYQPQKLYFSTWQRGWMKVLVKLMPLFGLDPRKYGRNEDIDLNEIASHQYPIHARIRTHAYRAIAESARDCHASQLPASNGKRKLTVLNVVQTVRAFLTPDVNTLMRAFPPVNGNHRMERDLFEGVTDTKQEAKHAH